MKLVLLALASLLPCASLAFAPKKDLRRSITTSSSSALDASRRDVFESVVQKTATSAVVWSLVHSPAWASGGATAGGAYLLSAKQRYNERVQEGVKGFLGIRSALEDGDLNTLREYFAKEDTGGWKDFAAAAYLLANAFRRNSTAPPDSLPSVKAWKKFAAAVEGVPKALKKKDTKGALAAYDGAMGLLDDYLKQVELPDAKEISMS